MIVTTLPLPVSPAVSGLTSRSTYGHRPIPRDAVRKPNSSETVLTLRRSLDTLAARRNTQQMAVSIARAAVVGVGLAALLMLAHRFYLVDAPWWSPVVLIVAALLIGVRNGTIARAGAFDAALDADRVLGLDERLSSALAFAQPELVRRAQRHQYGNDWTGAHAFGFVSARDVSHGARRNGYDTGARAGGRRGGARQRPQSQAGLSHFV
jgi:hypothetical protein